MILTWLVIYPIVWVPVRVPPPRMIPPTVKQQPAPLPARTWYA